MKEADRKAALARVQLLAQQARNLVGYDGVSSPPDWRPFIAELADEVALLFEALQTATAAEPITEPSKPKSARARRRKGPN